MKPFLLLGLCLAVAGCASRSIGDPHLYDKPNLLIEKDPLAVVRTSITLDHIRACEAGVTEIGPSSNIPVSEVEYSSYNQEGRTAHVINMPFSYGLKITTGPYRGKYLRVTVPPGFVTDFHSVPLSFTGQASSLRKAIAAAVVHDWMFAVGSRDTPWQRDLANQAFDEILKHYHVDSFTRERAQDGFNLAGNASFARPGELRFYNKCFYRGLCTGEEMAGRPELVTGPVLPMPHDDAYAPLRADLWKATVCLRDPAPDVAVADLSGG